MTDIVLKDIDPVLADRIRRVAEARGWNMHDTLYHLLEHGLFITEAATQAQAEHLLHIMLWSMLVFGFQSVIGGIIRASGTVLMPVAISVFCILGVELPMA